MINKKIVISLFVKSLILFTIAIVLAVQVPFASADPASDITTSFIKSKDSLAGPQAVTALPRNQTLYFNGLQWNEVVGWNPYSTEMNNSMAIAQGDNARVTVWETPYLYNMLDGQVYPLLADGPWTWNAAMTEIIFKIKSAAHWSDGTAVTAEDVAYTWDTHVKYGTDVAVTYQDFIEDIEVVDPTTVKVKSKLYGGVAVNPLMVSAYLSSNYVIQKAWTQTLEARTGSDAEAFMSDPAEDFVASGPYKSYISDDTQVVLVRDENYWGQDASMWGRLPAPKYLAHVIFAENTEALAAFKAGEVDISQQFIENVQDLWLVDHLPVSTYLADAPYYVGASLPTAFYNLGVDSLNEPAIRKAIAIAANYPKIIADAMTNQSATFVQVPRSLMNPTPYEQSQYDKTDEDIIDLQWAGNEIAKANAILDAAGIVDSNDGDDWREYNGQNLHYVATCPNGWQDWQAAIDVLAEVGPEIGIEITTNFPEWSVYQTIFPNWPLPSTGFDIFMMWSDGAGPAQPWSRIRHLVSSEYAGTTNNWNGNWGGYVNPVADALIQSIPGETDPLFLKEKYTDLVEIYLSDIPSFTLMYRPDLFHTVNKSVWPNFPRQGDGTYPPVPPLVLTDGWSIAGLYNLDTHLNLNIQATDLNPGPGEIITFTIQVTNITTETVTGGLISDLLPEGLNFLELITLDPPTAGMVGSEPPTLVSDLEIGAGGQVTVTLPVAISYGLEGGTTIINTAWVTSTEVVTPNLGSASITIANVPPVAIADPGPGSEADFSTDEDAAITTGNLLANDHDDNGDLLSIASVAGAQGLVNINGDGTLEYDPNGQFDYLAPGEQGTDIFEYTVSDGHGGIATATVSITIDGLNDPPNAANDSGLGFTTDEASSFITTSILANDGDPEDDPISITGIYTTGMIGLLTDHGNGIFGYDPNGQFDVLGQGEVSTDVFSYTISDGKGETDAATVTITITGINETPKAADDTGTGFTTDEDTPFTTASVLTNDDDPNGDILTVQSIDTSSTKGLVTDNGKGTFVYDPDGQFEALDAGDHDTDSFTYTVSDGNGGTDTATVTITINGLDDTSWIYLPLVVGE